jgi:ADP-heptose:LPS heptosyltransferase
MRTLLRRFDQFRRRRMGALSKWVYRQLGRDHTLTAHRLNAKDVHDILVLRNNKRIGNMYFMLPFMHALKQAYPAARIELMLIDANQAQVFDGLGLHRVWTSHFAFNRLLQCIQTLRDCRKITYDMILMPHSSATDTILGGLLHGRNKVCFWGPETSEVYRHAFDVPPENPHAALSALTLLRALEVYPTTPIDHCMRLSVQEREQARRAVAQVRGSRRYCLAYFRGARGQKIISDPQWHRIRQTFDVAAPESIQWVEILSPDIQAPLIEGTSTFASGDFRELAAYLAACDLFICGDTGPLHLADAANARCLGLFTATPIAHYGCMSQSAINLADIESLDAHVILAQIDTDSATLGCAP